MPKDKVRFAILADKDVQLNGYTAQTVKNKARDVAQSTAATVQDVSSRAKDVAQSASSTVQDTVQLGLTRTQEMLLVGLGLAQSLLSRNFRRRNLKKQTNKNLKQAQKNLSRFQDTVQDTLQTSFGVAQDTLSKNAKSASKNLRKAQKQAQKNLSRLQATMQNTMQSNVEPALGTAQEVLSKSAKSAGKSLKKVSKNVKNVQGSLQDRIESYQRKRARARFLFRVGLVAGVVLALMYAPWPGSKTRSQLGEYLQQLSQRAQGLLDRFSA